MAYVPVKERVAAGQATGYVPVVERQPSAPIKPATPAKGPMSLAVPKAPMSVAPKVTPTPTVAPAPVQPGKVAGFFKKLLPDKPKPLVAPITREQIERVTTKPAVGGETISAATGAPMSAPTRVPYETQPKLGLKGFVEQGIKFLPRAVASAAQTIRLEAQARGAQPLQPEYIAPRGSFLEKLLGTDVDPVRAFGLPKRYNQPGEQAARQLTEYGQGAELAKSLGAGKAGQKLAGFGFAGLAITDLYPGGAAGKKAAKEALEELAQQIGRGAAEGIAKRGEKAVFEALGKVGITKAELARRTAARAAKEAEIARKVVVPGVPEARLAPVPIGQEYSAGSRATVRAFEESVGQKEITTVAGTKFELGSFGGKRIETKAELPDRFAVDELPETLTNTKQVYRASNDSKSYRYDNKAWVAEMPSGEKRVVYTRTNKRGVEEILNWHKVDETKNPNFIKTLEAFGSPTGSRTPITGLENQRTSPLSYRAKTSLPQWQLNVKPGELLARSSGRGGRIKPEEIDTTIKRIHDAMLAKPKTELELDRIRLVVAATEEALEASPARQLARYSPKRGEFAGGLREVSGKPGQGEFARHGDEIAASLGYKDSEEARVAYEAFKTQKELLAKYRRRLRDLRERKSEALRGEQLMGIALSERRAKFRALKGAYDLNDAEMARIRRGRDISAMTTDEFNDFMDKARELADDAQARRQARIELEATIKDKDLRKTDNLREAMKLPKISEMTTDELRDFNEVLDQYSLGDEFLGVRQLETVKNTNLDGIRTAREARQRLAEQAGVRVEAIEDMRTQELIKAMGQGGGVVGWSDKYRYDIALARKNPLYKVMVEEVHRGQLDAEAKLLQLKTQVIDVIDAARKSRPRSIFERIVPTDKRVFAWLEAGGDDKLKLAQDMTAEELRAAQFIRDLYSEARDYLVQRQVLGKFKENYITHVRRDFLEAWKESGLVRAVAELMEAHKQEEAFFNILNQKTGDVLPLEKFFQFSMRRAGMVEPTKNVAKAVTNYFKAFHKKQALDSLIPKLEIYVHSLTPPKETSRGLPFNDSLRRFVHEWINTKKGRVVDLRIVEPGGPVDWGLRMGIAFTRILDLGLSIPVGVASQFGEQAANIVMMGTKNYTKGLARLATKRGRSLTKEYAAFVGEPLLRQLHDASRTIGDKLLTGIFGLFSAATRRANQVFLLGSMSDVEWRVGKIELNRLAQIKLKMGKYRVVEGAESTMGKTSVGMVVTQYKKWAVPILESTQSNIRTLAKLMKREGVLKAVRSEEGHELLRSIILMSAVGLGVYGYAGHLQDKKDRTFAEEIVYKAGQDALSLIGALDPKFWGSTPRLLGFIKDTLTAISDTLKLERLKGTGELSGPRQLKRTLEPALIRHLTPVEKKSKTNAGAGVGALPKLPKLPALPRLPKLR